MIKDPVHQQDSTKSPPLQPATPIGWRRLALAAGILTTAAIVSATVGLTTRRTHILSTIPYLDAAAVVASGAAVMVVIVIARDDRWGAAALTITSAILGAFLGAYIAATSLTSSPPPAPPPRTGQTPHYGEHPLNENHSVPRHVTNEGATEQ